MPSIRSARSRISAAVAAALLVLSPHALAQPSPFPLATAPSVTYAPQGPLAPSPLPTDPRVAALNDFLRAHIAAAAASSAQLAPDEIRQRDRFETLQAGAGRDWEVRFRPENHTVLFLRGALQSRLQQAQGQAVVDIGEGTARLFLRRNRDLLRIADPDADLRLTESTVDVLGRRHLRFGQYSQGLSVWPCEVSVHLDPDGNVDTFFGSYVPSAAIGSVEPVLDAAEARSVAVRVKPWVAAAEQTEPELIVYGPLDGPARLAWRFEAHAAPLRAERLVVDAIDGELLTWTSLVMEAAATGSGLDARGVSRSMSLWQEGNTFFMVDSSKPMFDPTSQPPSNGRGTIEIYDAAEREVQNPLFSAGLVSSASAISGWLPDAVGAAYGLSQTYDFYRERFGRNSLTGNGDSIRALVRYGSNVANAFWYGTTRTMVFGFGFTREIDISGHELTHGVIDSVGNGGILEYRGQSGALNEALADILGEMVEARDKGGSPDWLKADPFDPTNRDLLLQDYANPTSVRNFTGQPNPSKMSEFIDLPLNLDSGGVHVNSSIINHCYYLLAQGFSGGIGLEDASKVFYRAMTTYLQKQSQFVDMRLACVAAADDLFGASSVQAQRTREAFNLVELFDAPNTPGPTPIPVINAPDSTLFLRFDPSAGKVVLGRREQALGDGPLGTLLGTVRFVAPRRVSVSGDGSFAVFITEDRDVGFIRTDNTLVDFADLSGSVHSIAMAPDASRYAVVFVDPATQQPRKEIVVIDLGSGGSQTIPLLAPVADGTAQDIVRYADSMDFFPQGDVLVYDALSEIPVAGGGSFQGWTLFALDLATQRIVTLLTLQEDFDFGNPHLGNVRPHLLTYEVIDKRTQVSTVFAADVQAGTVRPIATLQQANVVGFPSYTGDDRAIVYTQVDLSVNTTVSLLRQALAEDGITPVGDPTLWLADADYAAIYRRGSFASSNALPQVQITGPAEGTLVDLPANLTITAAASDSDGTVTNVAFFAGSTPLGQDAVAPYSITAALDGFPPGPLLLTVRAFDQVGGVADSAPVEVRLRSSTGNPIVISVQPQSQTVPQGSTVTFTVEASGGDGPLTYQWRRNGFNLGATSPTLQLGSVSLGAAGAYSVVISDGFTSVTSSDAQLTVLPISELISLGGFIIDTNRFQLVISGGDLNEIFQVQRSLDLTNWTTVATRTNLGVAAVYVDPDPAAQPRRFYRIQVGAE